jgi:hypothetical protein
MSEEQNTDTVGSLKIRVANMLLNTVALSESLNIIRDVCVRRAEEIIDNASTEQLENIKTQVDNYEESLKQQQEANDQAAAADPAPAEEATGPAEVSGPSGPDPSGCSI